MRKKRRIARRNDYTLGNIILKNWLKLEEDWLRFVQVVVISDFKYIVLR